VRLDAGVPVVTLNKFCGGFQLVLQHGNFLRKLVPLDLQSIACHNSLLQRTAQLSDDPLSMLHCFLEFQQLEQVSMIFNAEGLQYNVSHNLMSILSSCDGAIFQKCDSDDRIMDIQSQNLHQTLNLSLNQAIQEFKHSKKMTLTTA